MTFTSQQFVALLLLVSSLGYGGLALVAQRNLSFRRPVALALISYCGVALVFNLALAIGWSGLVPATTDLQWLSLYSVFCLAIIRLHVNRTFLRLAGAQWQLWVVGGIWLSALVVFHTNLLALPERFWNGEQVVIYRLGFVLAGLVFGWALMTNVAVLITFRNFRAIQQPLHRNRVMYWAVSLCALSLGDVLIFNYTLGLGSILHLLATVVISFAAFTHRLPDIRRHLRQSVSYIVVTAIAVLVYTLTFIGAYWLLQPSPYALLGAGATTALIIVILFTPLTAWLRRWVDRLLTGHSYDPNRLLGEYSLNISNILELDRVADVALNLIRDTMHASRGALFLVDLERQRGEEVFGVRWVRGFGLETVADGFLKANAPLAAYLSKEYTPLTHYDIDFLPRFRETPPAEYAWLAALHADVYVPIYAKRQWIGLLVLGPKTSKDRYFDDDLALLNTLADQTAVVLENARLVENLRQSNTALDQVNRQLAKLDKTKSDLISVLSHELITPLTLLQGYSELLGFDPNLSADTKFSVTAIHTSAVRMHEIIKSMLDVTKIDSRLLDLSPNPVELPTLMQEMVEANFAAALAERKLILELHPAPNLPPVEADAEALEKVFYHLVINAIKYTPDGGRIDITYRALSPNDDGLPEGGVEVIVSDSGIGIDFADQELIFTKFYQTGNVELHSSGKTKFKGGGPGLGLAIALGIVQAHRGKLWVDSLGYDEKTLPGSEFHVMLPVRQGTN